MDEREGEGWAEGDGGREGNSATNHYTSALPHAYSTLDFISAEPSPTSTQFGSSKKEMPCFQRDMDIGLPTTAIRIPKGKPQKLQNLYPCLPAEDCIREA